MAFFLNHTNYYYVYWIEISKRKRAVKYSLFAAPIEIAEELESLTDSLKQELGEANEAIRQSAPDVYESIQGWIEQIKEFVDSLTSEE